MRATRAGRLPTWSIVRVPGIVLLGLAIGQSGCAPNSLAGYLTSTTAGFVLGRLTAPVQVETRCFRNGEEIDCTLLPD